MLMNSKLDRLKEAVRYLKGKGIISTQQDIATKMNYGKSSVSMAMNGNEKYFTDSFIGNFNKSFGDIFNTEYLIDGCGSLLMEDEVRFDNTIRFLTLYDEMRRKFRLTSEVDFSNTFNFNIEALTKILNGEKNIEEVDFEESSNGLIKYKDWIFTGANSPFVTGEFHLGDDGRISVMHTPNGMIMLHKNAWEAVNKSLGEYGEYLNNIQRNELNEKDKISPISIPADVWAVISNQAKSLEVKDRQTSEAMKQTSEVIELLKEQLKKGQYAITTPRVANQVVEEDE